MENDCCKYLRWLEAETNFGGEFGFWERDEFENTKEFMASRIIHRFIVLYMIECFIGKKSIYD